MSMQLVVFGNEAPPSAEAWAAHAAGAGFKLHFPVSFNTRSQRGAVAVRCQGIEAAFEYYNDDIREYLAEVGHEFGVFRRWRLSRFARAINFVTHSRTDDWLAACVAAATCVGVTGGQLLDTTTGRFMNPAQAHAWAVERVHNLLPRNASERRTIAAKAEEFVERILMGRGFVRTGTLELVPNRPAATGERWYLRLGKTLPNELVQVETYFDGEEAFTTITFWGTTTDLGVLARNGLIGNAAGVDLFTLWWGRLEREPSGVLPRNIPVAEDLASTETGERLLSELVEADELVWPILATEWEDLRGEGFE